ncbi:MAG: rane protein rbn [Gammaproteobacteria bacterium]|jgi:membrane protein|nr:rane protein rbn [Gammaproteobacteria bacterium]
MRQLKFIYQHFLQAEALTRAAALAFTTTLAVVPLMVVLISVLSLLPYSKVFVTQIQDFILSNFVASASHTVLTHLKVFISRAQTMSWYSILFLMVTAVSMLFSIENALNVIWQVSAPRYWLRAALYYLFILICVPVLLLASFSLSFLFSDVLHGLAPKIFHERSFLNLLPVLASFVAYFIIYKIIPHCHVPYRCAAASALLAAILFESAKHLFALYLKLFPTYQIIYGAIAAVPIFLIWVYICWVIFLLCATVGRILAD